MADNLPALQDKRLSLVRTKVIRNRKLTNMFNTKLKDRCNHITRSMDKTKNRTDFKMWQKTLPIKHSLVHIKGTQKCLKRRREHTFIEDHEERLYGIYDGESLREMQPEINSIIHEAHPSTRRIKKVNKLLDDGRKDGRILDIDAAQSSLQAILKRPGYPRKRETILGFDSPSPRPFSVATTTPDPVSREGYRVLPPITVNRENTKPLLFRRMRADTLPTILPTKRSNTFAFEPKLNLRRLSQFKRF